MASKRNQIVDALAAQLQNVPEVSGRVYRSRMEAFQRSEAPAIIIEPGPDNANTEPVSTCHVDWSLTVFVMVIARGAIPDEAADPIVSKVYELIMADRTVGGLAMDCYPAAIEPTFESADRPASLTLMSFDVRYRSSLTSIES